MSRLLLCSDLDRTLLPNGTQPESPGARARFSRLAARPEVMLAYVTGRHRELVERALASYGLPLPDYVLADVGTTIYAVDGTGWQELAAALRAEIAGDWAGHDRDGVRRLLGEFADLRPQEAAKQGEFKLSFYVPLYRDAAALVVDIERQLAAAGVAAQVVWSIDEPRNLGLLDVLPAAAGKLHALTFLAARLGFAEEEILFAGDSGNDLAVLTSAVPSVLVANATAEVRAAAVAGAAAAGHAQRLHLARGDALGMNGNYAAGVLEGVLHFHPEAAAWCADGDAA